MEVTDGAYQRQDCRSLQLLPRDLSLVLEVRQLYL